MKKLFISIAATAIFSVATSYAQNNAVVKKSEIISKERAEAMSLESKQKAAEHQEKMEEKMRSAPPERKERTMARREKFKSLSPEKQRALKVEMKRHREEMRKITGEDLREPHHKKAGKM